MENKDKEVKPGSIIIPHAMTRKNGILSRAMTFLSEEDGIGKEIFKELESLMDKGEEVKPDFEKIAIEYYGGIALSQLAGVRTEGFEQGAEKIWSYYVIPLQSKLAKLREDISRYRENFKKANYARNEAQIECYKLREENERLKNDYQLAITAFKIEKEERDRLEIFNRRGAELCKVTESDLEKAKELMKRSLREVRHPLCPTQLQTEIEQFLKDK